MTKIGDAFKKLGGDIKKTASQAGSAIASTGSSTVGSAGTAFTTLGVQLDQNVAKPIDANVGTTLDANVAQPADRTLTNLPRDVTNAGLTVAAKAPGIATTLGGTLNDKVAKPVVAKAPGIATTLGDTLNTSVAKPFVAFTTKAGYTINADVFQRIRQNAPGIARTGVAGAIGVVAMTPLGGEVFKTTLAGNTAGAGSGGYTESPAAPDMTTPLLLAAAGVLLLIAFSNR